MQLKNYIQLVVLGGSLLHSVAFFPGKEFETGRCFVDGDGILFVAFNTTHKYDNFVTTLCEEKDYRQTKGANHSSVANCEVSEDGTVTCQVLRYTDYISLKRDYKNNITRYLFLYGQNKSGSYFLAEGSITTWDFCLLRTCEQTIPLLIPDENTIQVKPDKVDMIFPTVSLESTQNPPEGIEERTLNVTLEDTEKNMSTVVVSRHFSRNNIPLKISENIPKTCGNYNRVCVSNGFKYCTNEENTLQTHYTKMCSELKPYYQLPVYEGYCRKTDENVTAWMELRNYQENTQVPVYFLYSFETGDNITEFNTSKAFYTFPYLGGTKEVKFNVSLCNECKCSSPFQMQCQESLSNALESDSATILIVTATVSATFVCCVLVFLVFFIRKKWRKNSQQAERKLSVVYPIEHPQTYHDIPEKPNEYVKLEMKNKDDELFIGESFVGESSVGVSENII